MSRYRLLENKKPTETTASSKAEIDAWLAKQLESKRIDWRVGYMFHFRDNIFTFDWVHENDHTKHVAYKK